jgi:rhodanese-related sulfurtransferase
MAGEPRLKPASIHRLLAGVAALGGVLAAFAGNPYPAKTHDRIDVRSLAAEVTKENDHVTALELAQWIKDRKPGLRVVDLRSPAEFDEYHVPGATRLSLEELVATRFAPDETLVLISDGGAHAAQGWVLLRASGYEHVYFLRGGLGEWLVDVMNPVGASPEAAALSRYFGGLPRKDAAQAQAPANSVKTMKRRGC